jgi:hypothetical protein
MVRADKGGGLRRATRWSAHLAITTVFRGPSHSLHGHASPPPLSSPATPPPPTLLPLPGHRDPSQRREHPSGPPRPAHVSRRGPPPLRKVLQPAARHVGPRTGRHPGRALLSTAPSLVGHASSHLVSSNMHAPSQPVAAPTQQHFIPATQPPGLHKPSLGRRSSADRTLPPGPCIITSGQFASTRCIPVPTQPPHRHSLCFAALAVPAPPSSTNPRWGGACCKLPRSHSSGVRRSRYLFLPPKLPAHAPPPIRGVCARRHLAPPSPAASTTDTALTCDSLLSQVLPPPHSYSSLPTPLRPLSPHRYSQRFFPLPHSHYPLPTPLPPLSSHRYSQRVIDVPDSLPKYAANFGGQRCTDAGELVPMEGTPGETNSNKTGSEVGGGGGASASAAGGAAETADGAEGQASPSGHGFASD